MSRVNGFDFLPEMMTVAKKRFEAGKNEPRRRNWNLPLVSIVVLNWNGERVIRASLSSIKKLDYLNTEVIVVDNGSTDRSTDIIEREYPDFQLVRISQNLGFSAGMNVGMKESHGDLILIYNNDAVIHPTSLSRMVKALLAETRIGLIGGLILYYKPNNVVWTRGGKLDPITGTIWSDGLGQKAFVEHTSTQGLVRDLDYISGCVLLARKEVVQKIGLLDEQSIIGGQDVDWCLKARRAGYECVLDQSALVWHIGSFSTRQMPVRNYAERQRSDFRLVFLHFPVILMFSAVFFQILVAPLFEFFFFRQSDVTFRYRLRARVGGLCENLKNVRKLISERRRISHLGHLRLKVRTLELLRFAAFRTTSKEFFMGKSLQELE